MKKSIGLVIALLMLMIAPLGLAAGMAGSGSVTGTASLNATLGAQTSTISYTITGTLQEKTITSLNLQATLKASGTGSATLNGAFQVTEENSKLPDASVAYTATYSYSKEHFSSQVQGSLYLNLSSYTSTTQSAGITPLLLPGTPSNTSNTTTPTPTPTPPPVTNGTTTPLAGITGVYLDFKAVSQGYYNGTMGETTSKVQANFNVVGGASIVGLPGNATGVLIAESHTKINGTRTITDFKILIAFNSGNQQVDAGLTALLYNYLNAVANKTQASGKTQLKVTSNGTAVTITGVSEGRISGIFMPGMPGMEKIGCTKGFMIASMANPFSNTSGVPLFFENASATGTLKLQATVKNGVLNAEATFNGQVEGLNPKALTFYPTDAEISITASNGDFKATVNLKGEGDPATAYIIAKRLALLTLESLDCQTSTATVKITSDGSVHFYNAQTGEDLGTSIELTCNNLGEIKYIVVAPPNTTVKAAGQGIVEISTKGEMKHVKLSLATIANAKVVVVNSKKVVIETGKIMLSQPKMLVVKAGEKLVVHVEVHANTKINGSLEVMALNQTEANTKAEAYGYTAAGAGVQITGIEEGAATINLPTNKTEGIAILEISANGQVKLITDYKVEANGTVTFNATSFSTFVVVNTNQQATPTTTASPTQTTTSSPSTTTQQAPTGTSTQPSSQSSSPTNTQATSTTGTTTSSATSSQTAPSKSGSSTATIAAGVIIVVLIIAGAVYALKK